MLPTNVHFAAIKYLTKNFPHVSIRKFLYELIYGRKSEVFEITNLLFLMFPLIGLGVFSFARRFLNFLKGRCNHPV